MAGLGVFVHCEDPGEVWHFLSKLVSLYIVRAFPDDLTIPRGDARSLWVLPVGHYYVMPRVLERSGQILTGCIQATVTSIRATPKAEFLKVQAGSSGWIRVSVVTKEMLPVQIVVHAWRGCIWQPDFGLSPWLHCSMMRFVWPFRG